MLTTADGLGLFFPWSGVDETKLASSHPITMTLLNAIARVSANFDWRSSFTAGRCPWAKVFIRRNCYISDLLNRERETN